MREVVEWTGTVKCGIIVDQKADGVACIASISIKTSWCSNNRAWVALGLELVQQLLAALATLRM